jgi:hypothetical protein
MFALTVKLSALKVTGPLKVTPEPNTTWSVNAIRAENVCPVGTVGDSVYDKFPEESVEATVSLELTPAYTAILFSL